MWALIFITIALRFSPKRLENFIGFNHKASDLGYYASYDLIYLQKCDFTLKTLFPVQNKENDAMANHGRRHQITTRNSKNNILHGVTLLVFISGDIAENLGPIKCPCRSCAKPVKKNQKDIQCEDCLFWYHIKCIGGSKSKDCWPTIKPFITNKGITIIWICIHFVLHDVFYCAVFNLCNLLCMSV